MASTPTTASGRVHISGFVMAALGSCAVRAARSGYGMPISGIEEEIAT
jgi:hypothetical protein